MYYHNAGSRPSVCKPSCFREGVKRKLPPFSKKQMSSFRAHSNENESFYQFLIKHLFNRPSVAGAVLGCISSFVWLRSLIHLDRPGVARAVSLSYLDSKLFFNDKIR